MVKKSFPNSFTSSRPGMAIIGAATPMFPSKWLIPSWIF